MVRKRNITILTNELDALFSFVLKVFKDAVNRKRAGSEFQSLISYCLLSLSRVQCCPVVQGDPGSQGGRTRRQWNDAGVVPWYHHQTVCVLILYTNVYHRVITKVPYYYDKYQLHCHFQYLSPIPLPLPSPSP